MATSRFNGGVLERKSHKAGRNIIRKITRIVGGNYWKFPNFERMEISYGQDVHRRVGAAIGLAVISFGIGGLMALTKSKKHYIGITWATADTKGGFAMQCDKNDYRGILAGLEGITGKKAVDSATMTVNN